MYNITLTVQEIEHFHEHGFVVIPRPLIAPEEIERLKQSLSNCFAGNFDLDIYPDEWHWREGLSLPTVVREICNAWKSDSAIQKLVLSNQVGCLGGELYPHWDKVRVGQDDIFWKVPLTATEENTIPSRVGYHIDGSYISQQFIPSTDNSVTVWIALDDADYENGVVEYISGSHQWTEAERQKYYQGFFGGEVPDSDKPGLKNRGQIFLIFE